ncbi:MAG: hypothetical protein ACJ8AT_11115 [Hyalangium sp.]|uniref:hypothetical protein n=1 Tax=Hyalangium sp. TaxID=2028555 RepID=UPI00389B04E3
MLLWRRLCKAVLLLAVLVAPRAHAADETGPVRAVVEAAVSHGSALSGPWAPRTSYSASLWGLGPAGQGLGARLSWLPPAPSTAAGELSTDALARFTGEGPLYFKAVSGAAFTPGSWMSPRLRAGGEVGVHAIRGSIGLELGVGGVYAFAPSQLAHGEGRVSLGVGLLFGFGPPPRAPALAPPQRAWAQQAATPPASALPPQALGPLSTAQGSTPGLTPAPWEVEPASSPPGDVIQQILLLRKPWDVQRWWDAGPGQDVPHWSHPLSEWELKYLQAMSAQTVPEPLRMGPPVTPERLTPQQRQDMAPLLGTGAAAAQGYAHWENRRRIVTHYVLTHPVTVGYQLLLYGASRDINPLHFALERGWQMASGQELFTARPVSQLGAAQEFFTALAAGVAAGELMTATRPVPGWAAPQPVEPLGPGNAKAPPAPPRIAAPAPEPAPAPAPEPAPAPAPPPPAPSPLAPSPELVQALTGKNPTPQVPAGPRLPRDVAVKPDVPGPLKTGRPISPSPGQNAQLQADIKYLKELRAENIRVNQQQLTLDNGQRVGINRPDLQFDFQGRRYYVEYDSHASDRGLGHQSRLTANDPDAEIILIIVP